MSGDANAAVTPGQGAMARRRSCKPGSGSGAGRVAEGEKGLGEGRAALASVHWLNTSTPIAPSVASQARFMPWLL